MAAMMSCCPTVWFKKLPLHEVYFVHVHRLARAVHREGDRQSDRDLRGGHGDHQHRVSHPRPASVRQVVRERHQREVDGVDHQLDTHKDHHGVAPDKRPPGPDGEHDRADDEIRLQWNRRVQRVEKLLCLRRHYSSTPLSTPSPVLRRLTTIAATTATRSSIEITSKSSPKIGGAPPTPSSISPKGPGPCGPFPGPVALQS